MKVPGPDHPITVAPAGKRVRVAFAGRIVADSVRALVLEEAGYKPVFYIPRADADMALLARSAHASHCPYKGDASYFTISAQGRERGLVLRAAVPGGGGDQGPPRLLSQSRRQNRNGLSFSPLVPAQAGTQGATS